MPHLELVGQTNVEAKRDPQTLFKDYKKPEELLDYAKFFNEEVFQRYQIEKHGNWTHAQLADQIAAEEKSTLVILNTIADTRALHQELTDREELADAEIILLNTHFVLDDRRAKIARCKQILEDNEKTPEDETRVVLISTQLIEAGVDVDFPVVMRDLCPLPNLIQSAGRCNRNKKLEMGRVVFFTLVDDEGKERAYKIYRLGSDQSLLRQTCESLGEITPEAKLLPVQREFFKRMAHNFEIGRHPLLVNGERDENANLIEYVRDFDYPVVGSFRLIDEAQFGEQWQIYVPRDEEDEAWEVLEEKHAKLVQAFRERAERSEKTRLKIELGQQLKAMSGRVLTVRCSLDKLPSLHPNAKQGEEPLCGLRRLVVPNDYNSDTGLQFAGESTALI